MQENLTLLDDEMIEILRDWSRFELFKIDIDKQKLMAQALIEFGNMLRQLQLVNKAVNLELCIKCYSLAGKIFQEDTQDLDKWIETQNLLATAYKERIRGDKAENLEIPIEYYRFILEAYRKKKVNIEIAKAQYNLAIAYEERIRGDKSKNLEYQLINIKVAQEVLIDFFNSGIEFYCTDNSEKFRFLWALGQTNLAHGYMKRISGSRDDNMALSIKHYQLALTVYTEASSPEKYLEIQNSLNNINQNKFQNLDLLADLNLQITCAYHYRGMLKEEKLNDMQGALVDYSEAISINSKHAEVYKSRANLKKHKLNDLAGSIEDFRKARLCIESEKFWFLISRSSLS